MTDIQHCDASVTAIGPDAPVESVVETICLIDGLMARAKALKAELDARVIERIKASGEFSVGDVRYYVGYPKETKLAEGNAPAAAEDVMRLTGGDVGQFCSMLVSQPFKPGAVQKLYEAAGEQARFDELFVTTRDPRLKLGKADVKFLKAG